MCNDLNFYQIRWENDSWSNCARVSYNSRILVGVDWEIFRLIERRYAFMLLIIPHKLPPGCCFDK